MRDLRARFGYGALRELKRPLLGEDYVFDPGEIPTIKPFLIVGSPVSLLEKPLALRRRVYLRQSSDSHTSLLLTLSLCWNGFRDAVDLLFGFTESFQGALPQPDVIGTRDRYGLGDFGLAWAWSDRKTPDVLCFVRHNVLATLTSVGPLDLLAIARGLDEGLSRRVTVDVYRDVEGWLVSTLKPRTSRVPNVPAAGRLTIGPHETRDRLFFITTSGSVNRDLDRPEIYYYRAGLAKGKQEIALYRVGAGILPTRERLALDVT